MDVAEMGHLLKDVKKGSAFNSSVMSAINCSHPLGHRKNKRVIGKHLLLLFDYAKAFDCVDHNKLWKILKEMGIPNHLICLLGNL